MLPRTLRVSLVAFFIIPGQQLPLVIPLLLFAAAGLLARALTLDPQRPVAGEARALLEKLDRGAQEP